MAENELPARFISVEIVVSMAVTLFMIGGVWAGLQSSVQANTLQNADLKEQIATVEKKMEASRTVANTMQRDIAVILAHQQASDKTLDSILEILKERTK